MIDEDHVLFTIPYQWWTIESEMASNHNHIEASIIVWSPKLSKNIFFDKKLMSITIIFKLIWKKKQISLKKTKNCLTVN